MDEVLKDERFSHILTDPSFRRIPRKVRKIKIDNRFKTLLKNKSFKEKCDVDEHGCALKLGTSENLKKLYNMEEKSSESEESTGENEIDETKKFADVSKNKNVRKKKLKVKKLKRKDSLNAVIEEQNNEISLKNLKDQIKNKKINDKEKKQNFKDNHRSEKKNQLSVDNNKIEELSESYSINDSKLQNLDNADLSENLEVGKEADLLEDNRFNKELDSEENSSGESDTDNEEPNGSEDTDSSEEDSDDESESDDSESKASDTFDHQWEEQHERAPDTDEITRRLAVCHMDWDRIRAVDLYAVFNSFKPPDTSIISVKIYPSEYGLQRMEEEKLNGPRELVEKTLAPDEEEVEDKKGSKYHREKLRQYQMNRLKYYYAIVECDIAETANTLYEQLNGMEYESSSVRFDLRFVPDDTIFDHEPTSVAENPDLNEYKPKLFVTTALQQVKVGLTWDETDPQRREILQKAFTEPDDIEKDIKEYLASTSEEESEEETIDTKEDNMKLSTKERIQKYKALLESINEQEKEKSGEKYEMEITWEPGVKEKTENLVKEKLQEKSYTPFEESLKKRKEKQKLKKKEKKTKDFETEESEEEQSEGSDSDSTTEMEASNIKKKKSKTTDELYLISDAKKEVDNEQSSKKKKKAKKETNDDLQVDINDPRFSAIYTSPLFNIDPSDPHFKKTPGNLAIIAEKQRRLKKKNSFKETKNNKKMKYN